MRLDHELPDSEIPTSSMADIAFLLIIYFMLTAAFATSRGLDLGLPREDEVPPPIDPVESILVEIDASGSLAVDSLPVAPGQLLATLRPKLERDPAKPVIVRPDPAVGYGTVVGVLDQLRQGRTRLGLEREIDIALPTEREIQLFWPA